MSLSVRGAVRRRGRAALALQAAAAAALQGGAGRFRASSQRRRGGAGERRGPHAVPQDACTHQELPGAVGRRSGATGAWGSDVLRRETPPAGDVIDPHIWAVQGLGPGLETQHPVPLIHLSSLLDGCHDGF